jgi:hypothetical protein
MIQDSIINNRAIDSIKLDTLKVNVVDGIKLSKESIEALSNNPTDIISVYAIPLLSIIVASIALYFSKKAYENSKKHNVISLKPLLIFRETTMQRKSKIRLYMANKGIGPLTFTEFEMQYENQTFNRMYDLFEVIIKKFGYTRKDFDKNFRTFTNPVVDYSLKIDEEKSLIKYHLKNKTLKEAREFYNEFLNVRFVFTYVDLYDNEKSDSYQFKNYKSS